ncbi:MAG: zinc-dependent peptidase [Saprospiraceae bacterium]|nr:zinc-dependent peptidase [Saprospiraceae bacterium]
MLLSQIIAISLFLLIGIAIWWWLFPKKNKPTLAAFPAAWRAILSEKVAFYDQLQRTEKARFEASVMQFLDSVRITGVGTEVNDTDRLLVAASAVIPLFGFPGWYYNKLNEVILYAKSFNQDYNTDQGEERNILGLVGGSGMTGTMILSKPSLYQGFLQRHSSHNVGIHEFVHLLDRADGATDGVPEALLQQPFLIPWMKLMHQEIKAIQEGSSEINPYGSTNEAEFLSVVSEYFFQQPDLLEKRHPELFALLEKVYKQDL